MSIIYGFLSSILGGSEHDNNSKTPYIRATVITFVDACMRIRVFCLRYLLVIYRLYFISFSWHGFRVIKMICRVKCSLDTIFLFHHKTITVNQSVFEQYSKRSHVSLIYPFFISCFIFFDSKYIQFIH